MSKFGKDKASKAISFLKMSNKSMLEKKVEESFFEASKLLKTDKSNLVKVNEDQFIEEFLPKIVCTNANCEVVDKSGNIKGYITNKELQSSLTKS